MKQIKFSLGSDGALQSIDRLHLEILTQMLTVILAVILASNEDSSADSDCKIRVRHLPGNSLHLAVLSTT